MAFIDFFIYRLLIFYMMIKPFTVLLLKILELFCGVPLLQYLRSRERELMLVI